MKGGWVAVCLCMSILAWGGCARELDAGPPVVAVAEDPWIATGAAGDVAAEAFAACAACHMADGSGRSDGSVPRLAGQRHAIVVEKLRKLRSGAADLPVMVPFARALTDSEIEMLASYVERLPDAPVLSHSGAAAGEYAALCAGCHGAAGEGNDGLLAPRLCGQHEAYLLRRFDEIVVDARGDTEPAMAAILASLDGEQRRAIARWLAGGECASGGGA